MYYNKYLKYKLKYYNIIKQKGGHYIYELINTENQIEINHNNAGNTNIYILTITINDIEYKYYILYSLENESYYILDLTIKNIEDIKDNIKDKIFLMINPCTDDSIGSIDIQTKERIIHNTENITNLTIIFYIIEIIYQNAKIINNKCTLPTNKDGENIIIINDSVKFNCNDIIFNGKLFRLFTKDKLSISIYYKHGFRYIRNESLFNEIYASLIQFTLLDIINELNDLKKNKIVPNLFFHKIKQILEFSEELSKKVPPIIIHGGTEDINSIIDKLINILEVDNKTQCGFQFIKNILNTNECSSICILIYIEKIIKHFRFD